VFTGIIAAIGSVKSLQNIESEWRLVIDTRKLKLDDVGIGDSIAVNGCCLTVVKLAAGSFSADVSNESMRCTTLGGLSTGTGVNLEKAMLAGSRFGGHMVSGHVDGVGKLRSSTPDGQSQCLQFEAPPELAKYIAAKGSICIDGTSLTVNEVRGVTFTINVIPHTQEVTVIGQYVIGQQVNLEVDLVARYLERLMQGESAGQSDTDTDTDTGTAGAASKLDQEFLQQHGFKSS
jgi:riboflavin synthase